mmetsp:Transcript_76545/g.229710  ORF Transcript_76545/g.229710 Transcript_76545/m.229710 type:complete len:298 (+) Transcript_76545:170-1063(+)
MCCCKAPTRGRDRQSKVGLTDSPHVNYCRTDVWSVAGRGSRLLCGRRGGLLGRHSGLLGRLRGGQRVGCSRRVGHELRRLFRLGGQEVSDLGLVRGAIDVHEAHMLHAHKAQELLHHWRHKVHAWRTEQPTARSRHNVGGLAFVKQALVRGRVEGFPRLNDVVEVELHRVIHAEVPHRDSQDVHVRFLELRDELLVVLPFLRDETLQLVLRLRTREERKLAHRPIGRCGLERSVGCHGGEVNLGHLHRRVRLRDGSDQRVAYGVGRRVATHRRVGDVQHFLRVRDDRGRRVGAHGRV